MHKKLLLSLLLFAFVFVGLSADNGTIGNDEISTITGSTRYYDCHIFEDGDYALRYVYMMAGQHTYSGKAIVFVERRGGEYVRLRIEILTGPQRHVMYESHLYVGAEPPKKMAPGRFPQQQVTVNGATKHIYYVDLDSLGDSFENLYIAIHAVVQPRSAAKGSPPEGSEETAWGFKTHPAFYPVLDMKTGLNELGDPWGTIFPKKNKQWPAYFMVYVPYNVTDPWFECPQPLYFINHLY